MEPSTRLDYIIFQLTPTRTRCDLVIFAGKLNEKLAYGLLDPFISHLRSAKDQIAKGGYSVTLRPPTAATDASWFTKATVLRFVRFLSTPEVLERAVTIEREIQQIESSINSYEGSTAAETQGNSVASIGSSRSANSLKTKGEFDGSMDGAHEESSMDRLQRVLDTRKAVLRKEQAMAYARGLAAGFEIENLDDLLSFSDAFGAARLREACINFIDLWKKKNEDRFWMDEIAAMQACVQPQLSYVATSGIILTGDDNDPTQSFMSNGKDDDKTDSSMPHSTASPGSLEANQGPMPSTDGKHQMPLPWANQLPPYMHNFRGPVYQQMPPYQGYAFPGMPPYFPGNIPWPPNMQDTAHRSDREQDDHRSYTSSSKKKERSLKMRRENEEENTEPSDSSAESDSFEERLSSRTHRKKSAKKVVIRNINYITSKRNGKKSHLDSESSPSDEDYLDDDSLKQVEEAVGSLGKHHKITSHYYGRKNYAKDNGSFDKETGSEFLKNNEAIQGNGSWDALQELLMREGPASNESCSIQVEEQSSFSSMYEAGVNVKPKPTVSDSFLSLERETGNESSFGKIAVETFESGGSIRPLTRKENTGEEFLPSDRVIESYHSSRVTPSDYGSSIIKGLDSDEWITGKPSDQAAYTETSTNLRMINGNCAPSLDDRVKTSKKDLADDSLVIHSLMTRPQPPDDQLDIQPRFDIDIVPDATGASMLGEEQNKRVPVDIQDPEELYMVLHRDTSGDHVKASWSLEMDFENSISLNEAKVAKPNVGSGAKLKSATNGKDTKTASTRDARSRTLNGPLGRSKPDPVANNRRSTFGSRTNIPRSKLEKEEENRKRMEELLTQRQKRIAERTTANGPTPASSKKNLTVSRERSAPLTKRPTAPSLMEETKRATKSVLRCSTIQRLATAKASSKDSNAKFKATLPKEVNGEHVNKTKPSEKKTAVKKWSGMGTTPSVSEPGNKVEKQGENVPTRSPTDLISWQSMITPDAIDDSEDVKELHITPSVSKGEEKHIEKCLVDERAYIRHSDDLSKPAGDHHVVNNSKAAEETELKHNLPLPKAEPEPIFHTVRGSPIKQLNSKSIAVENATTAKKNVSLVSPEICEIKDSTPQSIHEMGTDPVSLRKKWNDAAKDSSKASKGFKQLLMFGRRKVEMA